MTISTKCQSQISSCPKCEFSGNITQKVTLQNDGILRCHTCNSTWRELKPSNSQLSPNSDIQTGDIEENNRSPFWQLKKVQFAAILTISILATGIIIHKPRNLDTGDDRRVTDALTLSEIKFDIRQNIETNYWVVSARVTNQTQVPIHIPTIKVFAGKNNTSKKFQWSYTSPLQILEPGDSFKFRTSIRKPGGNFDTLDLKFARLDMNAG